MRNFRFNIASLLVAIVVLGVGFAALREANETWDSGLFSLTLCVLLISILLAIHRTEFRRAFWIGFALIGWTYVAFSLIPSIESRLVTTKALAYLDSKVPGRPSALYTIQLTGTGSGTPSHQVQYIYHTAVSNQQAVLTGRLLGGWSGTTENFIRIGHSLFALLAGCFGGLLSRRLWRPSRVQTPETAGLS